MKTKNTAGQVVAQVLRDIADNAERGNMGACILQLHEVMNLARRAVEAEERKDMKHGINCEKAPHTRTGYLHGADDDSPYSVDGCSYCGRCHRAL